jgi:hypothetical protein
MSTSPNFCAVVLQHTAYPGLGMHQAGDSVIFFCLTLDTVLVFINIMRWLLLLLLLLLLRLLLLESSR